MASRSNSKSSRRPPSSTPRGRENQLIAAAYDLAERQIAEGSATAQVITHFLKLGTEREKLERKRIEQENLLLEAKVEREKSQTNTEQIYKDALAAMRSYTGQEVADED